VKDCPGIALHRAQHRHHVAADFSVGSERYISQDRDHVAVDFAVDVGIAQYRDRALMYRTRDARIAEHRDTSTASPSLVEDPKTETTASAFSPLSNGWSARCSRCCCRHDQAGGGDGAIRCGCANRGGRDGPPIPAHR